MSPGAASTPFDVLAASRYVALTTFRKDGTPVTTPVWVVALDAELWVWTAPDAGKVKRLRLDPKAEIAPCRMRGEPLGAPVPATGRLVADDQIRRVIAALVGKYGWQARMTFLPDRLRRLIGRRVPIGALAFVLS